MRTVSFYIRFPCVCWRCEWKEGRKRCMCSFCRLLKSRQVLLWWLQNWLPLPFLPDTEAHVRLLWCSLPSNPMSIQTASSSSFFYYYWPSSVTKSQRHGYHDVSAVWKKSRDKHGVRLRRCFWALNTFNKTNGITTNGFLVLVWVLKDSMSRFLWASWILLLPTQDSMTISLTDMKFESFPCADEECKYTLRSACLFLFTAPRWSHYLNIKKMLGEKFENAGFLECVAYPRLL
jgi:hypothetical protein